MWLNNFFPNFFGSSGSSKKLHRFENDLEFQNVFVNLVNLSTYSFKWNNLPATCNERFLELILCLEGRACIVKDPEFGFLSLKSTPLGSSLNMYGEYDKMFGVGWNGFNKEYKAYMDGSDNTDAEAVLCRDNVMSYPYYNYIIIATKRLTSCMRSIDVASKKLKIPYFITCDESQVGTVKKILEDVEHNVDSVIASNSTMPEMFKVFPTNLDSNVLRTLWESYNNLDAQIKTLLGVDTATNQDKKERLIVDEVNAQNTSSNINIKMRLECRQHFCDIVNETFGLNISVELRDDMVKDGFSEEHDLNEKGCDEDVDN
jgi:hypothetical protein